MPDLVPALFMIGAAYEEKGDLENSEEDYLNATQYYVKVLEKDPHNIGSLSNIAYIIFFIEHLKCVPTDTVLK